MYGYAFFYCFSVHENVKFPVGNAIYYVLYIVYLARGNSMTHTHTVIVSYLMGIRKLVFTANIKEIQYLSTSGLYRSN